MDIGRALTFFTEEERWIEKTTIGTLVLLVSILLSSVLVGVVGFFILTGYGLRLMRNVQNGVRPVLPEWDQWADDLARGFKMFIVSLVWSLPVLVVTVPTIFGAALLDTGDEGAAVFGLMLLLCGSCLSLIYGLFVALAQPGFTISFARTERIRSGLAFTEIWQYTRKNIGDVAVVAIVYVVGSLILSTVAFLVGLVACGIGLLVTMPLGTLVIAYFQYHLYGQLPVSGLGQWTPGAATYDSGVYTPGDTPTPPSATSTPAVPSSVVVRDPQNVEPGDNTADREPGVEPSTPEDTPASGAAGESSAGDTGDTESGLSGDDKR